MLLPGSNTRSEPRTLERPTLELQILTFSLSSGDIKRGQYRVPARTGCCIIKRVQAALPSDRRVSPGCAAAEAGNAAGQRPSLTPTLLLQARQAHRAHLSRCKCPHKNVIYTFTSFLLYAEYEQLPAIPKQLYPNSFRDCRIRNANIAISIVHNAYRTLCRRKQARRRAVAGPARGSSGQCLVTQRRGAVLTRCL